MKPVTTNRGRSHLVSQAKYDITEWLPKNLLATEMNRTDLKIDKPVCLDLLIVDISKIFMYEYLHDYIK